MEKDKESKSIFAKGIKDTLDKEKLAKIKKEKEKKIKSGKEILK